MVANGQPGPSGAESFWLVAMCLCLVTSLAIASTAHGGNLMRRPQLISTNEQHLEQPGGNLIERAEQTRGANELQPPEISHQKRQDLDDGHPKRQQTFFGWLMDRFDEVQPSWVTLTPGKQQAAPANALEPPNNRHQEELVIGKQSNNSPGDKLALIKEINNNNEALNGGLGSRPTNEPRNSSETSNQLIDNETNPTVVELSAFEAAKLGLYRHSALVSVILTIAYTIVFIIGIVGNSLVVAIVCKSPRMRTVTNYFIANLALADILVLLFCLPATLVSNLFIPYVLGQFVCKTVSYLQGVAVCASINTMVTVTLDRFLAICFPMGWHMSRRTARQVIACLWLFSLIIMAPWAVFFTLVPYALTSQTMIQVCAEEWPSERAGNIYFVGANLILLYLFPATVIIICYLGIWYKIERRDIPGDRPKGLKIELIMQKSKLKVIKMMMVVVMVFLISWLPTYLIFARIKLADERTALEEKIITWLMPLAQWMGASNSCINPILYTFFNRKYKRGFIDLLRYAFCCDRKQRRQMQQQQLQLQLAQQQQHYHHHHNNINNNSNSNNNNHPPNNHNSFSSGHNHQHRGSGTNSQPQVHKHQQAAMGGASLDRNQMQLQLVGNGLGGRGRGGTTTTKTTATSSTTATNSTTAITAIMELSDVHRFEDSMGADIPLDSSGFVGFTASTGFFQPVNDGRAEANDKHQGRAQQHRPAPRSSSSSSSYTNIGQILDNGRPMTSFGGSAGFSDKISHPSGQLKRQTAGQASKNLLAPWRQKQATGIGANLGQQENLAPSSSSLAALNGSSRPIGMPVERSLEASGRRQSLSPPPFGCERWQSSVNDGQLLGVPNGHDSMDYRLDSIESASNLSSNPASCGPQVEKWTCGIGAARPRRLSSGGLVSQGNSSQATTTTTIDDTPQGASNLAETMARQQNTSSRASLHQSSSNAATTSNDCDELHDEVQEEDEIDNDLQLNQGPQLTSSSCELPKVTKEQHHHLHHHHQQQQQQQPSGRRRDSYDVAQVAGQTKLSSSDVSDHEQLAVNSDFATNQLRKSSSWTPPLFESNKMQQDKLEPGCALESSTVAVPSDFHAAESQPHRQVVAAQHQISSSVSFVSSSSASASSASLSNGIHELPIDKPDQLVSANLGPSDRLTNPTIDRTKTQTSKQLLKLKHAKDDVQANRSVDAGELSPAARITKDFNDISRTKG